MNFSSTTLAAIAIALTAFVATDAMAASARVTCEVRANRSKVSVDGRGLAAGTYTTQATSGANTASSGPETAVSGEIETDYDSNPADIAAGATAIPANFIQGARVTGKVIDSTGAVVATRTAVCRVRK
jgi:hypothetical protein